MKYILSLLLVLSLQGCYQVVNQGDIHKAIEKCGTLENIQDIAIDFASGEVAECIKPNTTKYY